MVFSYITSGTTLCPGHHPRFPGISVTSDLQNILSEPVAVSPLHHALTYLQTINFRLFQTESIRRRQFQICLKYLKVLIRIENAVGKGESARYEQFLLFPKRFQKAYNADK